MKLYCYLAVLESLTYIARAVHYSNLLISLIWFVLRDLVDDFPVLLVLSHVVRHPFVFEIEKWGT